MDETTGVLTLWQLMREVQAAVETHVAGARWVRAEVSEITRHRSGHVYLTLVEREGATVKAQCRANLWKSRVPEVLHAFEQEVGAPLTQGMDVLALVTVTMSPQYGLALRLDALDSTFGVGESERRRRQTLERLQREGLYDRNRRLAAPLVFQRLLVLSSRQAAGYEDFIKQLTDNRYGIRFHINLIPIALQGSDVVPTVRAALQAVETQADRYDAVVILRGGGARIDLSYFDEYLVAEAIARCPLPVLTGIGHEKDVSVADEVAWRSLKTPTAVAEFVLECAEAVWQRVDDLQIRLHDGALSLLRQSSHRLDRAAGRLGARVQQRLYTEQHALSRSVTAMATATARRLAQERAQTAQALQRLMHGVQSMCREELQRVQGYQQMVRIADPVHTLRRGFSVTRVNGRAVSCVDGLHPGQTVQTELSDGCFTSSVQEVEHGTN